MSEQKSAIAWPLRVDGGFVIDSVGKRIAIPILNYDTYSDQMDAAARELVATANAGHEAAATIAELRRALAHSETNLFNSESDRTHLLDRVTDLNTQLATATARAERAEAVSESDPRLSEVVAAINGRGLRFEIDDAGGYFIHSPDMLLGGDGGISYSSAIDHIKRLSDPLRAARERIAALPAEDREAVERVIAEARKEGAK